MYPSQKSYGHSSSTAASVDVAEESDAPSHASSTRAGTPSLAPAGAPQPESAESIISKKVSVEIKNLS